MSDFDNTLAYTDPSADKWAGKGGKTISRENCEAIRYFQSEGGLFTLSTGRPFRWLEQWSAYFRPNTYVSTLNGAHICSPDGTDVIFSQPLDKEFIDLAKRIRAACPLLEWTSFHSVESGLVIKQGEQIDLSLFPDPIYKLVFFAPDAQSDAYAEAIAALIGDRYISMRSWINGIEIQKKGTGKGDAVKRLKSVLGDRARIVVAAGDYENDVDMVRAADIGYAVANAVPALKAVAHRQTVSVREHAIARIIEELQ